MIALGQQEKFKWRVIKHTGFRNGAFSDILIIQVIKLTKITLQQFVKSFNTCTYKKLFVEKNYGSFIWFISFRVFVLTVNICVF